MNTKTKQDNKKKSTTSLSQRTLRSELRAIKAVTLRCLKTELRYPINFIMGFIGPIGDLAMMIILGFAFKSMSGFYEYTGVVDFVSFFVVGQAFWIFWCTSRDEIGYSIRSEQLLGTLEITYACPFRRFNLLIGYYLSSLTKSSILIIGIFAISGLIFGFHFSLTPINMGIVVVALLLTALISCGFGYILAGIVFWLKEPGILSTFLHQPFRFFSGASTTIWAIPISLRWISYLIPTSYSIDSIRSLLTGSNTFISLEYELIIMFIFAVILSTIGFSIFKLLEKKSLEKGTFASY